MYRNVRVTVKADADPGSPVVVQRHSGAQNLTNSYMTAQAGYPTLKKYTKTVAKRTIPTSNTRLRRRSPRSSRTWMCSPRTPSLPTRRSHYYGAGSCYDNDLTKQLQLMVDQHKVSTISMSFGSPSDAGMTAATKAAWDRPLRQAALTGISAFASTGDSRRQLLPHQGKPTVGYPASNAYLTAVGGTTVGMRKDGSFATVTGWETRFFTAGQHQHPPRSKDVTAQHRDSARQ